MARSSSRSDSTPARPAPRLYVLVPSLADPAGIAAQAEALRQAAQEVDIAAVLLRPLDGAAAQAMGPLLDACHAIGAAGLLEGNAALVATLGADGAHFDDAAALKNASPTLRPNGIAGAGGLRTKHDAMTAAENGADYVMFGEPDAEGRRPPFEATLERTEWWAQLFEPPCVGYARTLDEVVALVAVGVDFVAVDTLVFEAPRDGARALAERLAAIGDAS
ncbi:thiamine phosphate synthase [Ancylobacter vacuolatus]|uniref:Thiamine-phosphate pyrophosphorylase n=1 Tax=Ancylobacter vacuolatus TaxID=223389 RepID=A0ABU0DJ77_9HYPH|nr:thiamine phosphate synthase [Ancylobacter vacuolatus]MDQ0348481.1 thiamine-phosphate pyrophosphorylase [Ancylobacter vacuolatus]